MKGLRLLAHCGGVFFGLAMSGAGPALADCSVLPNHAALLSALDAAVAEDNGGLGNEMWATIVDRDGIVCVVAFSGEDRDDQWPGSRVISAQKANTANAFSLDGLALSTANLYSVVQPGGTLYTGDIQFPLPGGSLYGLQHSNPVDPAVAYQGPASDFGQPNDPMVGKAIGGINVFGGGLALYDGTGVLGGLGVSGDTSCTDHAVAWRVREALVLDFVPAGVNAGTDNIIHDLEVDRQTGHTVSPSGFGHPECSPPAPVPAV